METKFTKGKWEVTPYQNVYCGVNRVCTIGDLREITEEAKANALLISKAPEMFEMLVKIIENYKSGNEDNFIMSDLIDESEQLLKEATEI